MTQTALFRRSCQQPVWASLWMLSGGLRHSLAAASCPHGETLRLVLQQAWLPQPLCLTTRCGCWLGGSLPALVPPPHSQQHAPAHTAAALKAHVQHLQHQVVVQQQPGQQWLLLQCVMTCQVMQLPSDPQ